MIDLHIVGSNGVLAMLVCVCIGCEVTEAPLPLSGNLRVSPSSATPIPLVAIESPPRVAPHAPRIESPTVLRALPAETPPADARLRAARPKAQLPELSLRPADAAQLVSLRPSVTAPNQLAPAPMALPPIAHGRIAFIEGYTAGLQRAASDNKPLLLFFTARWCHYCHQMADEAFTDAQVVAWSQRFTCVLIDADADRGTCQRYGVSSFPTLQMATAAGVPINRMLGKHPASDVIAQMQAALQATGSR